MFDFGLDAELELIVQTSAAFAAAELAPQDPRGRGRARRRSAVAKRFAETGLAGLELPEALGGAGLGALARALVNEELGAADPGAALALDPLGPALYALREARRRGGAARALAPLLERTGARAVLVCRRAMRRCRTPRAACSATAALGAGRSRRPARAARRASACACCGDGIERERAARRRAARRGRLRAAPRGRARRRELARRGRRRAARSRARGSTSRRCCSACCAQAAEFSRALRACSASRSGGRSRTTRRSPS